jgi:ABC-2 type transport system permease protein
VNDANDTAGTADAQEARHAASKRRRPMTLWRLEWLRLFRTRRWIALAAVYLFFGLTGPPLARYASELLRRFGSGNLQITVPPAIPADGISNYIKNASQIGLVVVVVVAAGALTFDARPEIGAFLRTRTDSIWRIVEPRFWVSAGAAAAAFVIGSLAAWYETAVLIGGLSATAMLAGIAFGALYLAFAVAVVALAAAVTRGTLAVVMLSLAILIALPIMGLVRGVGPWMPSELVGALDALARGGHASDYVRAACSTIVAGAAALWFAVRLAARREL